MSKKKGGFGKFLGGIALGAGLGILFAPDKGENTRKVLSKKIDELLKKVNDIDLDVGYYPIYHDTFADLFEEVDRIEALYQVKVLGLRWRLDSNNKGKVIRCLKGNRVISLNLLTGETNFED